MKKCRTPKCPVLKKKTYRDLLEEGAAQLRKENDELNVKCNDLEGRAVRAETALAGANRKVVDREVTLKLSLEMLKQAADAVDSTTYVELPKTAVADYLLAMNRVTP